MNPWADECNVDLEMCIVCRFVGGMGRNAINRRKKVPFVGDNRRVVSTGELDCEKGGKQCLAGAQKLWTVMLLFSGSMRTLNA